jgi:hypothetical protein
MHGRKPAVLVTVGRGPLANRSGVEPSLGRDSETVADRDHGLVERKLETVDGLDHFGRLL